MNKFLSRLGRVVFWLGWPFWVVYFRIVPNRTRVLVVSGDKILLVRSWLGADAWGLPGGGAKRSETLEQAAVRELHEETGVATDTVQLKQLGSKKRGQHGLRYTAHYFSLHLPEPVPVKKQLHEIAEVAWFTRSQLDALNLNLDTRQGLEFYGTQLWYNDKL